ncbi:unnamed protein product [Microthlaspi erraticum]|uniref:Uncharacterized protein n=1 Tax=Microthlaspi erraticum TaxID=1685480 RepID=A0A6D2HLM5_9BRAS|nr:unnamed protein product [Microthlaspi erraticum]
MPEKEFKLPRTPLPPPSRPTRHEPTTINRRRDTENNYTEREEKRVAGKHKLEEASPDHVLNGSRSAELSTGIPFSASRKSRHRNS